MYICVRVYANKNINIQADGGTTGISLLHGKKKIKNKNRMRKGIARGIERVQRYIPLRIYILHRKPI